MVGEKADSNVLSENVEGMGKLVGVGRLRALGGQLRQLLLSSKEILLDVLESLDPLLLVHHRTWSVASVLEVVAEGPFLRREGEHLLDTELCGRLGEVARQGVYLDLHLRRDGDMRSLRP